MSSEIIIVVAAIAVSLYIINFINENRKQNRRPIKEQNTEQTVQETSVLIKKLLELNSQYNFNWSVQREYVFTKYLKTKSKIDKYDLNNLFDENILNDDGLIQVSKIVDKNRILYKNYLEKVECLKSEVTQEQTKVFNISYDKYIEIEQKLFDEQQIYPICDCNIVCIALYNSPKRRNHYSKEKVYKIDEVPQHYEILQQRIAMQNSEEMRKKSARSQMTDKLRYTILKRDGFRCKICGRTADDGIKLHVDHIIPVSKGGETVPNNLRTLCETCNWGKSDEIEDI